jgi:hypothetical protein
VRAFAAAFVAPAGLYQGGLVLLHAAAMLGRTGCPSSHSKAQKAPFAPLCTSSQALSYNLDRRAGTKGRLLPLWSPAPARWSFPSADRGTAPRQKGSSFSSVCKAGRRLKLLFGTFVCACPRCPVECILPPSLPSFLPSFLPASFLPPFPAEERPIPRQAGILDHANAYTTLPPLLSRPLHHSTLRRCRRRGSSQSNKQRGPNQATRGGRESTTAKIQAPITEDDAPGRDSRVL